MRPRLRAQGVGLWLLGAGALFTVVAVMAIFVPLVLVPSEGLTVNQRVTAENNLRTTLVQFAGGSILLFGTALTLYINREGQITERFTRAIDQLGETGKKKLDVRLGGIYALERIARESSRDRGPIVEVLTAFLREHARWSPYEVDAGVMIGEAGPFREVRPRLRADLQAVATVLGRNQWSTQHHVDLSGVGLHGVDLREAHLEEADLGAADLEGALLSKAHLERTNLRVAHLRDAYLSDARLQGACLIGAHLVDAYLSGAHLKGADLEGARLQRADLSGAHLEDADLTNAYLEGANLAGAYLKGANLEFAYPERANLAGAYLKGANLDLAHLYGASLELARLEQARLSGAHLERANLGGAHLEGADLTNAHLEGANLTNAHLEGANLAGAHLGRADFTGADVDGIIGLEDAHLEGATGLDAWKAATSGSEDKQE